MKINIKKIALLLFWVVTIIGYEFVYRWDLFRGGFGRGVFQTIVFSLPVIALIYGITTSFSKKANKILTTTVLLFLYIIFTSQIIYFEVYNGVFSFYTMATGGQVLEFWRTILSVFVKDYYRLGLLLIPLIIFFVFNKKIFDFSKNKFIINSISYVAFIFLVSLSFLYMNVDKKNIYSSYNLYFNTQAPILSTNKFGLLTTMTIDLQRTIFGMQKKVVEITVDNQKSNSVSEEYEYNNLDIDFDSLIENETDDTIISMYKYLDSLEGTKKNEYTGMFEGKNVVFFLAESLDPLAIDPVLTPTLYKLANSGFNFTNYYSPLYPASTADGEFRTEWSLISSIGNTFTLYNYRNVYSPYIFANSFSDYNINIYHNYNGDYYYRNTYFRALGYNNFKSCYYGLNISCGSFHESDLDMIDVTTDEYIDSETPFFAYYITLSGHLSYVKATNKMALKNWNEVENLPYSDKIKTYIAANIELDKALELLIDRLTEAGKLDDTVIVLTPDHYPYGLKDDLEEISEITGIDRTDKFEIYNSDMIIWNSAMEETVTVNTVGSQPDILPTLLNLFGVDYDSRMIIGQDLLSDSEGLVLFADRSWISDEGKYDSITNESFKTGGGELDTGYIDKTNDIVDKKFLISDLILKNDFYSKVFKQDEID